MPELYIGNIRGKKGDTGTGLTIKDFFANTDELEAEVPNPNVGDAYGIGESEPYDIYIYSATKGWVNSGSLQPDINEQAPTYAEATTLETLTSGEKISLAFGKIKKAIREFISHKGDTTNHITSEERTVWNKKAPSGHGLGGVGESIEDSSFQETIKRGSGFYQITTSEDTPHSTNEWLSLLQLTRSTKEGTETGVQWATYDFNPRKPKMWMRTILTNSAGPWFEMLHTGNIDNHIKIVSGSYEGNGKFGSSNKNSIPLDIIPQVMIISRGSGTPYKLTETSIIPFAYDSANERYVANTNKVLAGNEYSYSPSLNMYYANGELQWYTDSADSNRYKADLQSGYITFETLPYSGSEADKMKSINQLNWSERIYHYSIIGKKE